MWRLLLGFHNSFEQSRIDVQKSIKSEVFLTLDMFLTINLQDYNLSRILTQMLGKMKFVFIVLINLLFSTICWAYNKQFRKICVVYLFLTWTLCIDWIAKMVLRGTWVAPLTACRVKFSAVATRVNTGKSFLVSENGKENWRIVFLLSLLGICVKWAMTNY